MFSFIFLLFITSSTISFAAETLIMQGRQAIQQKNRIAAEQYLKEALQKDPLNSEALFYLGTIHYYAQNGAAALPLFKQCYELNPSNPLFIRAYSFCANNEGDHQLARDIIERHYGAEPQDELLRTKLLPLYIRDMDWYYALKLCSIKDLWWYNFDLQNKTVLLDLSSEWNGRGDIMQCVRYAKHLHAAGAKVTVCIRHLMKELLSLCPYIDSVIAHNEPKPKTDHTFSLTTDRLALIMRSTLYQMSKDVPYLFADSDLTASWQKKISSDNHFKVGICFQSIKMLDYFTDKAIPGPRAFPIETLEPLFSLSSISFYFLQVVEKESLQQMSERYQNVSYFPDLDTVSGSFMDTAALMKQMDLVITVDTSIAHLAGGLGVPTWIMLPCSRDFRWLSHPSHTPWYPSVRLFTQQKQGEWDFVIQQIKSKLQQLIS